MWVLAVCCAVCMLLPHYVLAGFELGSGEPVPVLPVEFPEPHMAALDEELAGKVVFIVLSREPELATLVRHIIATPLCFLAEMHELKNTLFVPGLRHVVIASLNKMHSRVSVQAPNFKDGAAKVLEHSVANGPHAPAAAGPSSTLDDIVKIANSARSCTQCRCFYNCVGLQDFG